MALTAGQRIGPYVVERVLPTGQGGFAQVVLARDLLERGELVAVKVQRTRGGRGTHASTAFEAALSNEVEILRRVQHPGIVRIVPIPIDPDRPIYMARDLTLPGMPWYFAMEYLAGGTLEELIQREGRLEPAMAAEIVAQVSAALAYLHRQGIAHLDVKPRNIMLRQPLMPGQAPQVVLGDLGMAQDAALSAEVEGGSIEYLAPERLPLLDGQPVPDAPQVQAAADVYALGVTLYFMLTGRMPYRGSRQRLLRAIRWEQPVLPELHGDDDPALCSLALAMLNKAPELRPSAEMVGWQVDRIVPPPRVWVPRGLSRGDQGAPALPSRKVSHSTVGRGAVGPDTERFKKTTADGRPAPRQKRFLRTAVIVLAVFSMLLLTGYVVATSLVDTSPSSGTEEMAVPGRTHTLAPTGGLTVAALGAAVIGQAAARSASATPKALPADASPLSVVGNEPASTLPLQLRWQYAGTLSQGQEFEVSFCYGEECGYIPQYTKANQLIVTPDGGVLGWPDGWRVAVVDEDDHGAAPMVQGPRWPLGYVQPTAVSTVTAAVAPTRTLPPATATLPPASSNSPVPTDTPVPIVPPLPTTIGPNSLAPDQPRMDETVRDTAFVLRWSYPAGLKQGEIFHLTYMRDDGQNANEFDTTERRLEVGFPSTHYGHYKWNVAVVRIEGDGTRVTTAQSDWWWFWVDPNASVKAES